MSRLRQTVLVVDDDASIRLLCRVNLELEGWRVLEADSVAAARERAQEEPLAVALLDVHIGAEDGIPFVDELRRLQPGISVALLTGSADPDAAAADALIPKPFTLEQLVGTVRDLTGRAAPAR